MRRKSFLLTLLIVLLGNTVAAKSFLDSLETRAQLPCDIQEYQQLNRQKLSTKVVSKQLPQVFDNQKQAEYYSLGKIVTKDCVLLLIEQKYEYNRKGYICKIEGKGKGAFISDVIHIVDNFRKVFILDGRKIIVSRVDTIDFGRKLDGLATEYYNLPDSYPASETKECTGLPKNLQEIKNVQWRELSTQYVKENIFQVQNEWNGNLFAYELPNENWQMISLWGNNYLCYKKGNERYPKMLEISDEIGKSINRQFFIVGSKIYILQMRIYDGEVAQWVEIYDLNDGELKRLYSSFRFGDNYEDGESDFISDMELLDVDYTFTLHRSDYEKIVWYHENLDSGISTNFILSDSVSKKIKEVKPDRMKIELYDGRYVIVECRSYESAIIPDGVIYSYRYEEESFVYKGVMTYGWVGGTSLAEMAVTDLSLNGGGLQKCDLAVRKTCLLHLSLNGGGLQKDKFQSNEQDESRVETNQEDVDYTFTLHKSDYKKLVWYSEVLDSEMVTAIIPNDSVFEKIKKEKPRRMKIELFDGGYSIIECYGIAKASPPPDGVIYSCRYDEEGFVYKGEAAYIWVGGKWIK